MLTQHSEDHRLVLPHKGQQQDKNSWLTWPGGFVLRPASVGHPPHSLLLRSYATAYGSDVQSRRRPVHLSCFEHQDTLCYWCLFFACQDAPFHLCPILPETCGRSSDSKCQALFHLNLHLPSQVNIPSTLHAHPV